MQVIKIGGNELNQRAFVVGLAQAVAAVAEPIVIVHGGGRAIANLQGRLGLTPVKVDGLRVTDSASLQAAEMVLSGRTNKEIVRSLLAAGVDALGISGVDGGLLRCVKKVHKTADLGLVGQVTEVRTTILNYLLSAGITPVISPISLGLDGQAYNVNADEAAAAVAGALQAGQLTFVSNVPGVLDDNGRLLPTLTPARTAALIRQGVIRDGMVPKVSSALAVIHQGVAQARIVDLAGLAAGGGTTFREPEKLSHSTGSAF